MRGLRTNLGEKHTYLDRTATNDSILVTATRIIRTKRKKSKKHLCEKSKWGPRPFGDFSGAEETRRNIRQELEKTGKH